MFKCCRKKVVLMFILYFVLNSLRAEQFSNFGEFESFILDYVKSQVSAPADEELQFRLMQINSDMTLPSCQNKIRLSLSQKNISENSNTVNLQCESATPWKMYVPIQIQHFIKVLAAAKLIKPHQIISAEDIKFVKRDKYLLYEDYFKDPGLVEGMAAARVIPEGAVFAHKNLKKVPLILKKQAVKLSLQHGAITVTMQGIALSNGFMHEQIKILNPSSKKTVFAEVIGEGEARILY